MGAVGTGFARHQGGGPALADLAAQAAQGDGVEVEGGGDLAVGQGQHFRQLGDEDSLDALIVAGVASDQVAIEEDAALIVSGNDFQSRGEGAKG